VTILAFLTPSLVDLLLDVSKEDSGWPIFLVVDLLRQRRRIRTGEPDDFLVRNVAEIVDRSAAESYLRRPPCLASTRGDPPRESPRQFPSRMRYF
jgi:hypothetical protein